MPLAPAHQQVAPAGGMRCGTAAVGPAGGWATEQQPRLRPLQPPQQTQQLVPLLPQPPTQPAPQLSPARVQQASGPQQPTATQLGNAFGSEISGATPSWLAASLPLAANLMPTQQAQRAQQAHQPQRQAPPQPPAHQAVQQAPPQPPAHQAVQQAQHAQHSDLHGLLTDDEVAMLLDDLLEDPLLLPEFGSGSDFFM
ncbi:hypothetical protein COHA_009442 [Chlorella ohadii]|uniref:Uncharacterized protein n=1 Tax=Chlorella ohadii TaxID=2649997 RepID=A0AAD5DH02_9CHLO|nr:hypothetical protein COHA_009442 [Chlorella ohadii]